MGELLFMKTTINVTTQIVSTNIVKPVHTDISVDTNVSIGLTSCFFRNAEALCASSSARIMCASNGTVVVCSSMSTGDIGASNGTKAICASSSAQIKCASNGTVVVCSSMSTVAISASNSAEMMCSSMSTRDMCASNGTVAMCAFSSARILCAPNRRSNFRFAHVHHSLFQQRDLVLLTINSAIYLLFHASLIFFYAFQHFR
ncbi:uncharacterized protein DMAD_13762 [Drosophila madeirensis]